MSRILLSTGVLPYRFSLEEISEMAAVCGVDGLEVVVNKRIVEVYNAKKEAMFEVKDAPVVSLHAPYHIIHSWGTLRYELLRTVEIARKTGIEMVVFHPPLNPFFQPDFWNFFKSIGDFRSISGDRVKVSIETMPRSFFTRFHCNPEKVLEWAREKNLFVTLDCTHVFSWGLTPLDAFKYYGERVKSIHLNNTHECSVDSHLPPQEGCINVSELLSYLKSTGGHEDLALVLEMDFQLKTRREIEKTIKDSVDFVRMHF